jgi:hypothetical protein
MDPPQTQEHHDNDAVNLYSNIHAIVDDMLLKYQHNDPVLSKFVAHMNQLPVMMSAFEITMNQRTERKKVLTMTSDEFIDHFLSDGEHNYFYNASIDLFFVYNNVQYGKIEEDDIVHSALTALQDYPELKAWKYKIKNQLIKRVKERELFHSIPESCTIQKVIGLFYPAIFTSRDAAKHFLTIIGDTLNKKSTNYYFISAKAKQFIKDLSSECCALFGIPSLTNVFKFKFYDHTFSECRLLNVNEIGVLATNAAEYASPFKRGIVDILCVASHYSKRFGCADSFLESPYCKDASLASHCFYLKTNDEAAIVAKFIATTTEPCATYDITWKKMQYLWKLFLEDEQLPYIIFTNQLKARLMAVLPSTFSANAANAATGGCGAGSADIDSISSSDCAAISPDPVFTGITSKHLPIVSEFLSFWNDTIVVIDAPAFAKDEDELEIDELTVLFNNYMRTKKQHSHKNSHGLNITDHFMRGLVKHFYGDMPIEDDKYIMNVTSKLWNKKEEIVQALLLPQSGGCHIHKNKCRTVGGVVSGATTQASSSSANFDNDHEQSDNSQHSESQPHSQPQSPHMTIYNAYEQYCAHSYSRKAYVVSKRYFEKYYDSLVASL